MFSRRTEFLVCTGTPPAKSRQRQFRGRSWVMRGTSVPHRLVHWAEIEAFRGLRDAAQFLSPGQREKGARRGCAAHEIRLRQPGPRWLAGRSTRNLSVAGVLLAAARGKQTQGSHCCGGAVAARCPWGLPPRSPCVNTARRVAKNWIRAPFAEWSANASRRVQQAK